MNKFDHVTFSSNILDPNVNFCNFSCRYFGAKFQISDRPSIHEKSIFWTKIGLLSQCEKWGLKWKDKSFDNIAY